MSKLVLIAGCGKTALDWGSYLLQYGNEVIWTSRSNQRIESLSRKIERIKKRSGNQNGKIIHIDNVEERDYFLIFEAIEESLSAKKELWAILRTYSSRETIMATNSSSILPDEICSGILGCHGFYPLILTKSTEVISTNCNLKQKSEKLISFLNDADIYTILQDTEKKALAVNRLLIPIQEEAFRRLFSGEDPADVDKISREAGLPTGILSMADSIGHDTLHSSILNYKKRFDNIKADALIEGTKQLVESGILGQKNKKGIASKRNFKFTNKGIPKSECRSFKDIFNDTFIHFLENGMIIEKDLKQIKESVFMMDK